MSEPNAPADAAEKLREAIELAARQHHEEHCKTVTLFLPVARELLAELTALWDERDELRRKGEKLAEAAEVEIEFGTYDTEATLRAALAAWRETNQGESHAN